MSLLLFLAAPLVAQQAAPPTGPVAQLSYLLGEWKGEAVIDMGPGGKHQATQQEWVRTAAGGTVITVIGQGVERQPDGSDRLIHDAFAVIYPDREGKPAIRAFRAGNYIDPEFVLADKGFTWSYDDPRAGRIRYTVVLTPDGRWSEIGERSADGGATWTRFYEMTLVRAGD
jgi:hypothetical protein